MDLSFKKLNDSQGYIEIDSRATSVNLSGNNLNDLERFFGWGDVTILDLSFNRLDISSPYFPTLPNLQTLNLSWNNLPNEEEDFLNLRQFLSKFPALTSINFSHNKITPKHYPALLDALSSLPNLWAIDLSESGLGNGDGSFFIALVKSCQNLTEIYFEPAERCNQQMLDALAKISVETGRDLKFKSKIGDKAQINPKFEELKKHYQQQPSPDPESAAVVKRRREDASQRF